MAKKNELAFLLQDYNATIDDSGALSIDASYEVDGIEENIQVPIEFQMVIESGKQKYHASSSDVRMLSSDQNSFYTSSYFDCDPDQLPDRFQIFFRLFSGKKSFIAEPNIPNKKGSGSFSLPPKTLLGANKWTASSFSLDSISVKNDNGDFSVEWSGSSTRYSDLFLNVVARSGSDESSGEFILKSPALGDSLYINGSNKLSISFDLYKAEKWQKIEKVYDLNFEHQETEEDTYYSDDEDEEETIEISASEDSTSNVTDQNWQEISERALNWYFNTYRKTDDLYEAENMYRDEMLGGLQDAGVCDDFCEIPIHILKEVNMHTSLHWKSLQKEFPQYEETILAAFNTFFDTLLNEAECLSDEPDCVAEMEKEWR